MQNKGVNIENIYIQPPELIIPEIDSNDSVGVVPNIQCFNHGDKDKNIQMYKDIISHLVEKERKCTYFGIPESKFYLQINCRTVP